MDKSLGTLYNKITNLFHSNSSSSSSSSAGPEVSSPLPLSTFLDRMIPTTNGTPINQRRSSSRISRQISIKTNDQRIKLSNDLTQQQM
jgi:hypothetical protein